MEKQHYGLLSRNVTIEGKRTSIRLENQMWCALKDIAMREECSIHDICTLISLKKQENMTLTASIRIFLMLYYKSAATEEGHRAAGHGNFRLMQQRAGLSASNDRDIGIDTVDPALAEKIMSRGSSA